MSMSVADDQRLDPRKTLTLFSQAWSRGDIDGLMSLMAEDAVYRSSGGIEYAGHAAIRDAFEAICSPPSDNATNGPPPAQPMFFDMHCLSFWSLDLGDGTVQGVDLISFNADGLITCKDAYRKSASSI